MKNRLLIKFLLAYLLLILSGFLLISTLGSHIIEKKILEKTSRDLYNATASITENLNLSSSPLTRESLRIALRALAKYQGSSIWLISPDGEIYLDTASPDTDAGKNINRKAKGKAGSEPERKTIPGFDPVRLGTGYYSIGDFFGQFDTEHLTVILPIRENLTLKGYVATHLDMRRIYNHREEMLGTFHLVSLLLLALSFIILYLIYRLVLRPVRQIIIGAESFASGNLEYHIPLKTTDELGVLADSLNSMADRLRASGDFQKKFLANVSHDFRSPLTSIKGYLEAIQDGTIPKEMESHYLDIVLAETDRLTKLTNGILTLNTLDRRSLRLNLTDFDLHQLLREGISVFEGRCTSRKISMHLTLTEDKLMVHADYEKIQQVVYNLLDNAIKFSSDHSIIEIETTLRKDKVYVSIRDHGVGIPKNALGKIWTRFYKEDKSRGRERKGNGLGLSITKEIIQEHHQTITAVSTPGVGTEFIFTLDAASSTTRMAAL